MTVDKVRSILKHECSMAGSQAAWAAKAGVSPAYVSDTLNGRNEPGPALLAALKIRKTVVYEWDF